MKTARRAWNSLLDILFPKKPEVTGLESIAPAGLRDFLPKAPAHGIEGVEPLFDYRDPRVRTLIWEIKYRKNAVLAEAAAEVLAETLMQELSDLALFEPDLGKLHPLIIPIPLSRERRLERGWNQSELVGELVWRKGLANSTLYVPNLLAKTRHTESQTSLSREARLRNLAGCFAVTNPAALRGRHAVLIDDVVTTGATIREARRTLLEAGARSVRAYTVAH